MLMGNLCQDNVRLSQSVKFHFISRPICRFYLNIIFSRYIVIANSNDSGDVFFQ